MESKKSAFKEFILTHLKEGKDSYSIKNFIIEYKLEKKIEVNSSTAQKALCELKNEGLIEKYNGCYRLSDDSKRIEDKKELCKLVSQINVSNENISIILNDYIFINIEKKYIHLFIESIQCNKYFMKNILTIIETYNGCILVPISNTKNNADYLYKLIINTFDSESRKE